MAAPTPYGPMATTIASALASGSACRFFGGGMREVVATTVIGFRIGLPPLFRWRAHAGTGVYEATAAALAGFAAVAAAALFPPLSPYLTTLGGLIILVPGFAVTLGFIELPGVEAAFRMILVAVSLAMGLLTANAVLPARPARRRRTVAAGLISSEPPGVSP